MQFWASNTLLLHLIHFAQSLGMSADDVLAGAGIDERLLSVEGALVPAAEVLDAFEVAAARSGLRNFGLMGAERLDHHVLGPIGLLLEQCQSLSEVHEVLGRFLHLHNSGIAYRLELTADEAVSQLHVLARGRYRPDHFIESSLAVYVRACRFLLGRDWAPRAVLFAHEPLGRHGDYVKAFRAPVRFREAVSGVVFSRRELTQQLRMGDPELRAFLESYLQSLKTARTHDTPAQVGQLLRALLPAGKVSIGKVAGMLGLTPRSLQRRLDRHQTSFSAILAAVRLAAAQELLCRHGVSVSEAARLVGYSETSVLSRFLREQTGMPPRSLRHAGEAGLAARGNGIPEK
jgi:AraC-like DNA-binding protein